MSLIELEGTTALVTGGGKRLGAAIATALAEAGCDLVVHCSSSRSGAEEIARRAASLGRRARVVQADLRSESEQDRLIDATMEFGGGRLGVLVNNAGNFERVEPGMLSREAWDRALLLNATVPYRLTIGLAGALRAERGCMIAVACVSALRPWKNYVPYAASKAALVHLVKGLALALAPEVRVNAVAPGAVLVPDDYEEAKVQALRARIPLQRLGDAGDIARAIVFLASNDYISGQVLAVDGGRSLS